MFSDALITYGPTITELETLKAAEKDRRRRIRVLQVRSQARKNASRTRELYELKKKCLIESVASELQEVYDRAALDDLQAKRDEYDQVRHQTGTAHQLAETWEDPKVEIERQAYAARQCAEDRSKLATLTLRQTQAEQRLREEEPRVRLRSVRELEDERAALVAALPKPPTVDELLNSNCPVSQPTVLVYDVTARNAVHTERAPSTVAVMRPDESNMCANNDSAGVPNAADAAQIECERLQAMEQEQCLRARESLIKADLRGQRAMKRERVRRHYLTLMTRLEELGRGDAVRLRNQLDQGGAGASTTDALVNRKLEKVFEDEVLRQFAERVPYEQEDFVEQSVMHESVINKDGENKSIAPDLTSEIITSAVGPSIGDRRIQPVFHTCDTRSEESVHLGESVPSSGLSGSVGSRGHARSIPLDEAEAVCGSNALTQSSHDRHRVKWDTSVNRDRASATAPDISCSEPVEPPCSTPAVIADTSESALGPGERPELPSLRARHRSTRSREGRTISSNDPPENFTNHSLDSVLDRPEYAPSTILQLTSTQDWTVAKSSVTKAEKSDCLSLSEQQEILDRELAEIDRRIARIRMGSTDFDGQETSRSTVSSVKTRVRKTATAENVPPEAQQSSTRKLTQLTPRDSVVVEGQTSRECSVKSPCETDWLTEVKSNCTRQSDMSKPTSINSKPSITPLPPTWMQKLSSIISTQVREIESARQSRCSSRSSGSMAPYSSVDHSSTCSSSTHLTSVVIEPGEGGDTLSKLATSGSVVRPQAQSSSPDNIAKDPSSSTIQADKSVDHLKNTIISNLRIDSETEFRLSETEPTAAATKMDNKQRLPTDLHASNEEVDHMPSPRMSLIHLTNSESAVLQSIRQLAARLAQTAIREASAELAVMNCDSTAGSFDPNHRPQTSIKATVQEPLVPMPHLTDEACTSSDNKSISTRTHSSSEVLSTTRSLKEELRAILTSSLISSLLNGTTPSSLNGAFTSTSETIQRLLGSSCSFPDPSMDKIVKQSDQSPGGFSSSSDLQSHSPAPTGISGPLSSPSDDHSSILNGSSAITVVSPPEIDRDELGFVSQADQTKPSQTGIIPTDSPSDQSDSVKVNKNWLLGLIGSENLKGSRTQSPSSHTWTHPPVISDQSTFHHLSPADLTLDTADFTGRNLSSDPSAFFTTSSIVPPTQHSSLLSNTSTGAHLFSFKPLPRLDEAPSEESIPDLSKTQLTVVDPLQQFPLVERETLQTPSTSWSDSRKSNEFHHLSRCCSTSNSNLNSASGLFAMNETPQKDLNADDIRDENHDDDQTTIHRLQTNLPLTPIEPCEALVVPCLGSDSAAPLVAAGSVLHREASSSINSQQTVEEDLNWTPLTLPVADPQNTTSTMHPPILGNITRNTTTIDSSIIWDEGEAGPSVNQAGGPSDEFLSPTGNAVKRRSPVLEVTRPVQSISTNALLQCRAKSPRPLSPADGAAAAGSSPCLLSSVLPDQKVAAYHSLPTICVDSDGVHGTQTESSKPFTPFQSIAAAGGGALHASWSSFTYVSKPPVDPQISLSDSLRSFQRHEISCCLLDDEVDPHEVVSHPPDSSPIQQHEVLRQKPDHAVAADVHKDPVTSRPKTPNADGSRRANTNYHPTNPGSNPLHHTGHCRVRGGFSRSGVGGVGRSTFRSVRGLRRSHLNCTQTQSALQDPLELAMSTVAVEGIRHITNSPVSKKPVMVRQTNASRGSKSRTKSLHTVRSRYLSTPHNPSADQTTKPSSSTSHTQNSFAPARATCHEPRAPAPPTCQTSRSTTSLIHSSSASMEQSLYEQLRRWRAVRLGAHGNTYLLPVVVDNSSLPPPPTSTSTTSGPWSSTQVPTLNGSAPSYSVSLIERVDFASVLPGPPPLVVERNADDEISSTTLWMNEIAFQPPASLNPRPSTPTPNIADRRLTSSETAAADEDDDNVATEADSSATHGGHRHSGRYPYRQSNRGSVAFIVDLDALALPNTACAGDELLNERRFPLNELHFATAPFRHQPRVPADSIAGPSSSSVRSTVPLERRTETDNATLAVPMTSQQPTGPVASEQPLSSRPKAPDSKSTGIVGVNHPKRRPAQPPEQKHREEQARLNRLRVKEFDRVRRERMLRRKKKTVA